ncbi:MAG: hypothetical protein NTV87_17995 [Ignavibacteriae bacterium]|jgi:hypothetical protein|nr:hypothetical protein [Ignavibacteriota bacterium]
MLAKYKVKQNCFFNFRNFKEGEIVLVEEEMGNKMKSLLEPHERREQKEIRGQADKPKSDIRKPVSAAPRADAEPAKNDTSDIVNYSEQLTFVVDDKQPAKNAGNRTKRKNGNCPAQNSDDKGENSR